MRRAGAIFLCLLVWACGQTREDIIEEFVTDSGFDYQDCGAGEGCGSAGSCLFEAFTSCTPARADIDGETHFVVPDDSAIGCHVIFFTGSEVLEKHKCLSVGGCAVREGCNLRNRWHL